MRARTAQAQKWYCAPPRLSNATRVGSSLASAPGYALQISSILLTTGRTTMRRFSYVPLGLLLVCFSSGRTQETNPSRTSNPASSANACPASQRVVDYPAGGPSVNNAWYANADRTIWATFWGWDFVRRGSDDPDPKTGYVPGQKVLWHKPTEYPLTVTGRRIDGDAPPLVYDIARDPRPRGPIQPSRVYFPAAGCWEIDAKAGSSELRFVVLVKSPAS